MMKLTIEITCDSSAFAEDPADECARILTTAAKGFFFDGIPLPDERALWDINGNRVGMLRIAD